MGESSVSPYGVAVGVCVGQASNQTLERWHRAAMSNNPMPASRTVSTGTFSVGKRSCTADCIAAAAATADGSGTQPGLISLPAFSAALHAAPQARTITQLVDGRVYRLTKLVEKPTAEFAREHLVSPGLGPAEAGGEGRHLVVFGQYILPAKRTLGILAQNIKEDRRERCVPCTVR